MNDTGKTTSSKASLKALLFSLKDSPASLFQGQNFLEPAKTASKHELDSYFVDPGISLSEVPILLTTTPVLPDASILPPPPDSSEFTESLQYLFSDGLCLSAAQILFHPYSRQIPRKLLPLHAQILPHLRDNAGVHLFQKGSGISGLRDLELTYASILVRTEDESIPIFITNDLRANTRRPFISLKAATYFHKTGTHLKYLPSGIGTGTLQLVEEPSSAQSFIFNNFKIDLQKQTLFLRPFTQLLQLTQNILSQSNLQFDLIHHEVQLTGHQIIHTVLENLSRDLSLAQLPAIDKAQAELEIVQMQPQVWITSQGHFQFNRKLSYRGRDESQAATHPEVEVWNLPASVQTLILGFQGGLSALNKEEAAEPPPNRKKSKRGRDVKFMRHAGFFTLILFETTQYLIKGRSSEGTPLKTLSEFHSNLFKKLGYLLTKIERQAGFVDLSLQLSLEDLVSKNVILSIQKFTSDLIQDSESSEEFIYLPQGEMKILGGTKGLLQILHALLGQIANQSKGQCFIKPRLGPFKSLFLKDETEEKNEALWIQAVALPEATPSPLVPPSEATVYSPLDPWLSPASLLQAILPLQKAGISLFYDHAPMAEMEMADFKPEFNIVERENSDALSADEPQNRSIDWFELHPKFFFKGIEISPEQLDRVSKEGVLEFQGKVYLIQNKNLPNVRRLERFWSQIQQTQSGHGKKKTRETYLLLPKSQTLEMLALRATGVKIEGGLQWQKTCAFYDSLDKKRPPLEMPGSFSADLKPYQRVGVQWLLDLFDLRLGGILADDMGLGKTIQSLAFLEYLRAQKQMGSVLIVVPTSLTYNWQSEAEKFSPHLKTQIFQTKNKDLIDESMKQDKNQALICTYGLFTENQEFFSKYIWNILILDEAQNLKNISSKRTTASRGVQARFKVCLTGTPLENHLGEFFSLLDLVVPGSLGDLKSFREKFVNPDSLDPAEVKFLKLKARPLTLRRTKSEILTELPPKIETTIKLPFEVKQEKIYRDIALSWNQKVKSTILAEGEGRSQLLMLTALLRLRQACSDPSSIPYVKYTEEPPKVSVLIEALQEITESGESALIFTQFLQTFDRIKKELIRNQIPAFSLHGGTSRPERERILKEFQQFPKGSALLMTLKTGGVGLNLVKASYVFHLEPWWNPAVENQATDRAHRIGQAKPVQVYRYLMRGSVEEKIEILKERKTARFNALFSASESESELGSSGSFLTKADFEYLLS